MTAVTALAKTRVLADVVPGGLVRDAALVLGGAGVIGGLAQVAVPLGFTPVPLSLGTFAVLLVGTSLGPVRGLLSTAIYLLAGMAGVGWFAEGRSGWAMASFGYILGFVLAGTLVGWLARRGAGRTVVSTIGAMAIGNLAIYAIGVPWLMGFADMGLGTALLKGVVPFLIGDAIKIALVAGILPSAWALARRVEHH